MNSLNTSKRCSTTLPNAVVNKVINKDMTPLRAWREHLGLTQTEVARRLGISQSAYAQQEAVVAPYPTLASATRRTAMARRIRQLLHLRLIGTRN